MMINVAIRTSLGINFLRREIIMLDITSVNITANPIVTPLIADVVTAKVGQVPKTIRRMGFSFQSPLRNSCVTEIFDFAILFHLL